MTHTQENSKKYSMIHFIFRYQHAEIYSETVFSNKTAHTFRPL